MNDVVVVAVVANTGTSLGNAPTKRVAAVVVVVVVAATRISNATIARSTVTWRVIVPPRPLPEQHGFLCCAREWR